MDQNIPNKNMLFNFEKRSAGAYASHVPFTLGASVVGGGFAILQSGWGEQPAFDDGSLWCDLDSKPFQHGLVRFLCLGVPVFHISQLDFWVLSCVLDKCGLLVTDE